MQRQARRSLGVSLVFTLSASALAPFADTAGRWLPLHLFLVGGLLSAISGATILLSVTWSAAPSPPALMAGTQRWLLAAGAVGVVAGREFDVDPLTVSGAVASAAALGMLGLILSSVRNGAVTRRFLPAIDGYLMAVSFGLVGLLIGALLALGVPGEEWARLRGAHLVLNLFGLVGLVIASTLPYFAATEARVKVSRLATPVRMRTAGLVLATGTVLAVAGNLGDQIALRATGLGVYACGIVGVLFLLPGVGRRQLDWAGPRLIQLGAGLAWWLASTVLLAVTSVTEVVAQARVISALVVGGFAQILVASVAYLGPVLRADGHRHLSAGFAVTRSWTSLVAANVAATGALAGSRLLLVAGLAVWLVDLATRAFLLVTRRPPQDHGPGRGAGESSAET